MKIILMILSLLLGSCSFSNDIAGNWLFKLQLNKTELPFVIKIKKDSDRYTAQLFNAEEKIDLDDISLAKDETTNENKILITLTNKVTLEGILKENQIKGHWIKHGRTPEYKVPFNAIKTDTTSRFNKAASTNSAPIAKKWKIIFSPHDISKLPTEGMLLFKTFSPKITASVLTKTGDYRYLEGHIQNNNITLYGFDGVFAFVFKGKFDSKLIKGTMHAGKSHSEPFVAMADSSFELPDPEKITYVEPANATLSFKLKNTSGEVVEFKGKGQKPTILQIFGSWCPNCIDETLFINKWLKDNPTVPVDIYAISFEREKNEKLALKTLSKVKSKLKMSYPLLLGGATKDVTVKDLFPQLKAFISFPTTIYIDKKGIVRKVHTGFNGPATGQYYDQFSVNFDSFIKKLVSE